MTRIVVFSLIASCPLITTLISLLQAFFDLHKSILFYSGHNRSSSRFIPFHHINKPSSPCSRITAFLGIAKHSGFFEQNHLDSRKHPRFQQPIRIGNLNLRLKGSSRQVESLVDPDIVPSNRFFRIGLGLNLQPSFRV